MKSLSRLVFGAVALATLLLASFLASPAWAAEDRWELIGPYGGAMSALTVAPSNPRILYAGTWTGKVYRSADAGVTWRDVTGDFPPGIPVDDLEVDPRNPAKAFAIVCDPEYYGKPAVGGLFKTVNGGQSWALVESLDECQVLDVAIDPRNPAKILAGTVSGLYQSNDGGASWRVHAGRPRLGTVTTVKFNPVTPGAVYAIDYDAGFLRSTNGGATWTFRNTGLPTPLSRFSGLTVSTGGPKTLFLHALSFGTPLYRSLDGGTTWSPSSSGLGDRLVEDMATLASPPRYYAATHEGLLISTNRGTTWTAMATPLRSPRVLAVPTGASGNTVIHAGDSQGLLKSRDRGLTWEETSRGLAPLAVGSLIIAPSNEQIQYSDIEMYSLDGGATWARNGRGPGVLAVHPALPRVAFGFIDGAIWRTNNATATWRRLATLQECARITNIVIDPQTPTNLYATGTYDVACSPFPVCTSLKSTDGGRNWSCMEDLPGTFGALLIAPSQPSTLYAVGGVYPAYHFHRTVDNGDSWQPVGADLWQTAVAALGVSPEDPNTLYANLGFTAVKSTDGAVTWTPLNGLPDGFDFALYVAPSDASVLYAVSSGTAGGTVVYQSTDAGASWTQLSTVGLPQGVIRSVRISPTDPRTVFVGTDNGYYRMRGAGE